MNHEPAELWAFLPLGYLITVTLETPVLLWLLSARHRLRDRFLAGLWLTACTYPIVIVVLPLLMRGRPVWEYLVVAETFAPATECLLFWWVWIKPLPVDRRATIWDLGVVVLANLISFGAGELFYSR